MTHIFSRVRASVLISVIFFFSIMFIASSVLAQVNNSDPVSGSPPGSSSAWWSDDEWYTPYGIKDDDELESPSAVPKLIKALEALEDIGPQAKSAAASVARLLRTEDVSFRLQVVSTLLAIDPHNPSLSRAIETFLLHDHPKMRIRGLQAAQRLGSITPELLNDVESMAKHDMHKKVRIIADRTWRKLKTKNIIADAGIIADTGKPAAAILPEKPRDEIFNVPNFYSAPKENALAVIIGIEKYQNISRQSDYSYNDAKLMKDYLVSLGYQERNIEFLTNERATSSGMRKSLEAWLPNNVTKDSQVLIYFSGHGAPDPKGRGYLVPYDGDPNYLEITAYPLDELYASLAKLDCKEIMVVMDSCFSGAGGRSVLPRGVRPVFMEVKNATISSSNTAVLSSSSPNQISTSYAEKGLGLFTYHFLDALRHNKMELKEIYGYIKPKIENDAKRKNIEQSPTMLMQSAGDTGKYSFR